MRLSCDALQRAAERKEDFEAVPNLDGGVFSRVSFLPTGAYEWPRGAGWRQLTGESPLDPGPTFDELKTIVADPEWRDDPDEKATTVAMECVRELKEDSENS
jgi:hypothetical protein